MSQHNNPPRTKPSKPDKDVEPRKLGDYEITPGDTFLPDQFVVTGPQGEVEDIVASLDERFPGLSQSVVSRLNLSELAGLSPMPGIERTEIELPFTEDQLGNLATHVYRVDPDSLEDVISAICDRALEDPEHPRPVFAEPHYLIEGSSGCIEGGPAAQPGDISAAAHEFWNQWAFGQNGINLTPLEGYEEEKDIRVGVFDTSPFEEKGPQCIKAIAPPLCLHVWEFAPVGSGASDIYLDHGLFVSSLVHAVAPPSKIHLIRVLNGDNLGDASMLISSICQFLRGQVNGSKALKNDPSRGALNGMVLNLSLGLKEDGDPGGRGSDERRFKRRLRRQFAKLAEALGLSYVPDAVSLETVLGLAWRAGAIVVACAGNQLEVGGPKDPEIPAGYPFVIGVAGHNIRRGPSNFSKRGDIAAPAGDGPPDRRGREKPMRGYKEDWLIGLSMRAVQPDKFMYWMGTSFAAPLVSGGAARLLLKGADTWDVRSMLGALPGSPPRFRVP